MNQFADHRPLEPGEEILVATVAFERAATEFRLLLCLLQPRFDCGPRLRPAAGIIQVQVDNDLVELQRRLPASYLFSRLLLGFQILQQRQSDDSLVQHARLEGFHVLRLFGRLLSITRVVDTVPPNLAAR